MPSLRLDRMKAINASTKRRTQESKPKNELSPMRLMLHFERYHKTKPSMSNHPAGNAGVSDVVRNSSLYREFQAEREEILRHKWLESERLGYDIGFERALTDWIIKHRAKWRRSRHSATPVIAHN